MFFMNIWNESHLLKISCDIHDSFKISPLNILTVSCTSLYFFDIVSNYLLNIIRLIHISYKYGFDYLVQSYILNFKFDIFSKLISNVHKIYYTFHYFKTKGEGKLFKIYSAEILIFEIIYNAWDIMSSLKCRSYREFEFLFIQRKMYV